MRVSPFISTQWPRNSLVDLLRKWNNASYSSCGQLKGFRGVLSPNIIQRGANPSYGSLLWGANVPPIRCLSDSRQCPVRQFTVSATLSAVLRVKIIRVSKSFRSRRRRSRLTPYYVARTKKFFSLTRYRSLRVLCGNLPSGKLTRHVDDTKRLHPKAPQFHSASRRKFFDTLRSLQLNKKASPQVIWAFTLGNAETLCLSETQFSPTERNLLLEAFHAQLKERFLEDPLVTRHAIKFLASRRVLDENEWVLCITLMAKAVYQALHGLDELEVEKRLATIFDTSIPLYVLMQAWKSFLIRKVSPLHAPPEPATPKTGLRKPSLDTNQTTQQHDGRSYESRLLDQCGLRDYDMNGITARRIIAASVMTLSAMTTWLAQIRPNSRLDFTTGDSMSPDEEVNGQAQFNVHTMSQREFPFLYMVVSAAKGGSANAIMLRAALARMGLSPSDTELLATSLQKLQVQSDAIEARLRSGWRGERSYKGPTAHPHARAAQALRYAIRQAANTDQLAKITDMTYTIHAKYPNVHLYSIMPILFRQYLALNAPEQALELLTKKKYLRSPTSWYMGQIAAHYLHKNDLDGFEYFCGIAREKNQRVSELSFERYCQLAGQDRALTVWLKKPAFHGSSLLLRRALQYYSDQKDLEIFEKAWHIGTKSFQWIPGDLQLRRVEILTSFAQPATAETTFLDRLDSRINVGRLGGNVPESTTIQHWKSTIINLIELGRGEQAESFLRLLGESEHASAEIYRLFMRYYLVSRNLRASERFAQKLCRKGEFPDDTDASRHLLCSLENLHILARQPMPAEIYSAIQNALAFRYGMTFGQAVSQIPLSIQRQIGTSEPTPGLSQAPADVREKHTWTSIERTYLAMLETILDESFEWGVADGQAFRPSKMGDQDRKSEHENRVRLPHSQETKGSYTRSQRVEDALMLDNFRRRESGKVNTPSTEQYQELLRAALFALPRPKQLALLGGDHFARGFTPDFEYFHIWDRFAHQFFVNHLHQFCVPASALHAIYATRLTSFGTITPENLLDAGIYSSTLRQKIVRQAVRLQYEVWFEKLGAVSKMVSMLVEEIRISKMDVLDLQGWEDMASLTQTVIKWSGIEIQIAEAEFDDLKAYRNFHITPNRPAARLTYRWWRYRLERAHLWARNSARDVEELEREWRDIQVNQPRLMLPAPGRDVPGYLVYEPKPASGRHSVLRRRSQLVRRIVVTGEVTNHKRKQSGPRRYPTKSYYRRVII